MLAFEGEVFQVTTDCIDHVDVFTGISSQKPLCLKCNW